MNVGLARYLDDAHIHRMAGHAVTPACQPMALQHHRLTVQASAWMPFDESENPLVERATGLVAQHRWRFTVDGVGASQLA